MENDNDFEIEKGSDNATADAVSWNDHVNAVMSFVREDCKGKVAKGFHFAYLQAHYKEQGIKCFETYMRETFGVSRQTYSRYINLCTCYSLADDEGNPTAVLDPKYENMTEQELLKRFAECGKEIKKYDPDKDHEEDEKTADSKKTKKKVADFASWEDLKAYIPKDSDLPAGKHLVIYME